MSKQNEPIVGSGYISTGQPYNTDNVSEFFEYVGKDENGVLLVRRKEADDTIQKAANVGAVLLGFLLKPFGG